MPTEAQVERLLTKAEPPSKSRTGEHALAHGRARCVLAGKSGSGKSRAWAAFCCGPIGAMTNVHEHALVGVFFGAIGFFGGWHEWKKHGAPGDTAQISGAVADLGVE